MTIENLTIGSRSKAIWDVRAIDIFCDTCMEEVEAGNRPNTHFSKIGWENLVANFSKKTNRTYTKVQLKNKWDALKNEWKLWKQLIGKETGLGWNDKKKTIDATEEWWEKKLETHPNAAKFRKEGITPEMEDKLDKMFSDIVATGEHAFAPSSSIHLSETPDTSNNNVTLVESTEDSESSTKERVKNEKVAGEQTGKKPSSLTMKGIKFKKLNSKKNIGGAAKLSQQIDRLVEAIESRNDTTYVVRKEMPGTSIAEVMEVVKSMPEVQVGSSFWFFTTKLFEKREKREMFATMESIGLKYAWLEYEYIDYSK